MKKIIEIDPSYYRLNLYAGNIIYFSHAKDVKDTEYIELSIKDIVTKIDELVEAYDSITTTLQNSANELVAAKKETADKIAALQLQISALSVVIAEPAKAADVITSDVTGNI